MNEGKDALWTWFGQSRASWITIPRVLAHEMPDEWQEKMAKLLNEYDETFVNWPDGLGTRVQVTFHNRIIKTPDWVINYRYPVRDEIDKLRRTPD